METDAAVVREFVSTCTAGWLQGWHERNGGNLSFRMRPAEVAELSDEFAPGPWCPSGVVAGPVSGEFFLVTGSGRHFRSIATDPGGFGIVEVSQDGASWRKVWGLVDSEPTSEWPSHLGCHAARHGATDGASRVIYHAHPVHVIALTQVLPLNGRDFTRALWGCASECPVVFPEGLGVLEWMVPGGVEIARASAALMRHHPAIVWAYHGLLCAGASLEETFGLLHTIEKAAEVLVKALSASGGQVSDLSGISDEQLQAIAAAFGVKLNPDYL